MQTAEGWEISWKGSLAWPLLGDEARDREGTASPLQDAGAWFFFVIKGHLASGSGMDDTFTLCVNERSEQPQSDFFQQQVPLLHPCGINTITLQWRSPNSSEMGTECWGCTSLRMPTLCWHCLGVSSRGHRLQPAGGTAVLIIHPAQLGTADKSHEIAFVLQLEDLHFTGIPFFLHITDELPTVPTAGMAVRILGHSLGWPS